MATRTINVALTQQTPKAVKIKFVPDLTSAGSEVVLEKKYEFTTASNGTATITLPVKDSGTITYTYYLPTDNPNIFKKDVFHLSAGSAIDLSDLIAAGGEATQTVIDYIDEQLQNFAGDMTKAVYDPQEVEGDVFDRANHTGTQAANSITEDSTHRFATDAEKATWNAKQDSLGYTPENTANKATDFLTVNHTKFPSAQAAKTYSDAGDAATLSSAQSYADTLVVGLVDDRGNFDASVNAFPSSGGSGTAGAILKGDLWTVSVAGTLGGSPVTAGDLIRALVNTPGQTVSNWAVTENNIGYVAENQSNKSTDVNADQASNTKYASVKAIYDFVTGLFTAFASAVVTFTNKTISGSNNTLSDIPQSAVTDLETNLNNLFNDLDARLQVGSNLSDLDNAVEARANLGLGTLATQNGTIGNYALIANGFPILGSALVSTNVGTKQALYTVPTGKKCIVYGIVFRNASADLSGMADDTNIGFNEFASNVFSLGATTFLVLTDSTKAAGYSSLATGAGVTVGNAGEVLGIVFLDTSINATVVVDVLGYLINA